jgi:hypothetical protein
MKFKTFMVAVALVLIAGSYAVLAQEQLVNGIFAKQKEIDAQGLTTPNAKDAIRSGCDVGRALSAALSGNNQEFAEALDTAEKNLRSVAGNLFRIASKKQFREPIYVRGLRLQSSLVNLETLKTGDDVLMGIAALAQDSSEVITAMKTPGGAGPAQFTALIQNNSDISLLILAFYQIFAVRLKA